MKVNQNNEDDQTNEEVKLDVRKMYFDECFDEIDLESTSTEEKICHESCLTIECVCSFS